VKSAFQTCESPGRLADVVGSKWYPLLESLDIGLQVQSSGDLKHPLQYLRLSRIIDSPPHLAQFIVSPALFQNYRRGMRSALLRPSA